MIARQGGRKEAEYEERIRMAVRAEYEKRKKG